MTAVEKIIAEINNELQTLESLHGKEIFGRKVGLAFAKINELLDQAKEMEREQIGDAWDSAYGGDSYYSGESYYNGTFKQQEQCKCGQPKVGGYSCQRTDCNQTFKQQEQ